MTDILPADPDSGDSWDNLPGPEPHRWPHRRDNDAPWTRRWYPDWTTPTVVPEDGPSTLAQLAREGAQIISRAEVWRLGGYVDEFPVLAGDVTYDANAAVLRTCDVTLLGPIPDRPDDPLAPSGSVLHLYRGARDWTGEELWQPVGVYGFEESTMDRAGRVVQISGFDFARYVQDARWEHPYAIAAGTPLVVAVETALNDPDLGRLPAALRQPLNATSVPADATVPATVWGEERDNDPWDDLQKLAGSAGMLLYFDRQGRPTLDQIPDPDGAPVVWDYTAGQEPTYLGASRTLTGRPYNVVVARGEPPDDAPVVEFTVEDDDEHSGSSVRLYRRPYFMTSSYITTEAQAEAAARGELNRRKGLSEQVTIASVPVPVLDVGTVVRAHDPVLHVDARYVVDQMSLPLGPGEMTLTTRRRRERG